MNFQEKLTYALIGLGVVIKEQLEKVGEYGNAFWKKEAEIKEKIEEAAKEKIEEIAEEKQPEQREAAAKKEKPVPIETLQEEILESLRDHRKGMKLQEIADKYDRPLQSYLTAVKRLKAENSIKVNKSGVYRIVRKGSRRKTKRKSIPRDVLKTHILEALADNPEGIEVKNVAKQHGVTGQTYAMALKELRDQGIINMEKRGQYTLKEEAQEAENQKAGKTVKEEGE